MQLPGRTELQRLALPTWVLSAGLAGVLLMLGVSAWILVDGLMTDRDARIAAGASMLSTFGIATVAMLLWLQATRNASARAVRALRRQRFEIVKAKVAGVMRADYGLEARPSVIPAYLTNALDAAFLKADRANREAHLRQWRIDASVDEGVIVVNYEPHGAKDAARRPIVVSLWQYGDACHAGVFLHRPQLLEVFSEEGLEFLRQTCRALVLRPEARRELQRHECDLIDVHVQAHDLLLDPIAWDFIASQMAQFASHLSIAHYNAKQNPRFLRTR